VVVRNSRKAPLRAMARAVEVAHKPLQGGDRETSTLPANSSDIRTTNPTTTTGVMALFPPDW